MRNLSFFFVLFSILLFSPLSNGQSKETHKGASGDVSAITPETKDIIPAFMEYCTAEFSHSDCECILKTYSDRVREKDKRELPYLEGLVDKQKKDILSNPGVTINNINAVCRLFDSANDQKSLAEQARAAGEKGKYKGHYTKQRELYNQGSNLAKSFIENAARQKPLADGVYCDNQYKINRIKKDLAEDDGILYPLIKREMALVLLSASKNADKFKFYLFHRVKRLSKGAKCLQSKK